MKEQENYRESFDFNIALIGFMGVGKSTVAASLSRMFGMKTVEMDQAIAERERMSIPEIFETHILRRRGSPPGLQCGQDEEERICGAAYRKPGSDT